MATAKKLTENAAKKKNAAKKRTSAQSSPSRATAKKARTKKAMTKKAGAEKTAAKKTAAKKTAAKKTAAKKTAAKKTAAEKTAAKKTAAKKAKPAKKSARKSAKKQKSAKKPSSKKPAAKKAEKKTHTKPAKPKASGKKSRKRAVSQTAQLDASLFAPLSQGERAEALRLLIEDPRLSTMANVGRYRVITVEPLAVKPPHGLAGRRLARLVIYDYAADRSVDGCVDLDQNRVTHLSVSRAQPMLAREEEAAAIAIALGDDGVKEQLSLGEEPLVAMHYWSQDDTSLSYSRRSAAVIFGRPDGSPALVAVVDLLDQLVCEIVPATQW